MFNRVMTHKQVVFIAEAMFKQVEFIAERKHISNSCNLHKQHPSKFYLFLTQHTSRVCA